MAVYRVRLNQPGGKEFRVVSTQAKDKNEAVDNALNLEYRHCAFRLDPALLADLEAKKADGDDPKTDTPPLRGRELARLLSHHQKRPYEVDAVEKVK